MPIWFDLFYLLAKIFSGKMLKGSILDKASKLWYYKERPKSALYKERHSFIPFKEWHGHLENIFK